MTKYDFSASEPLAYKAALRASEPITDLAYTKAIAAIDEARIGAEQKRALLIELDETHDRKRGRPKHGKLSRLELAYQVAQWADDILPSDLRPQLIERLVTGKRHSYYEKMVKFTRCRAKYLRKTDICMLYAEAHRSLKTGSPDRYQLFNLVDPSSLDARSSSEKALMIAAEILRLNGQHPPSLRRMHNIVSENSRQKREIFGAVSG